MFNLNNSGQGTIEYLVIMAVVIVISLIVVGLVVTVSSSPSQQIKDSSSKVGEVAVGGISIVESVVDPSGDSLIFLSNNSSDNVTLTRISVGGVDNDFSETIVGLDSKIFSLSNLVFGCKCSSGQKNVTCEYIITYTQNGLAKIARITKSIECVSDAVPSNPLSVVGLGSGTSSDPWVINSCLELQDMNKHLDGNYILATNIDCYAATHAGGLLYNGGAGFYPIGDCGGDYCNNLYDNSDVPFTGNFNGNNHTISGLLINRPSNVSQGLSGTALFGYATGNISNIGVLDTNVIGFYETSAIVGWLKNGTLSNSYATGDINGYYDTGGLVAWLDNGTISNSNFSGRIIGSGNSQYLGGVAGYSDGTISKCYSSGSILGGTSVGGLIGEQGGGIISNSFATGNITGTLYVGGLIGTKSSGTLSNVWWYNSRSNCCGSGTCNPPSCTKAVDSVSFYPIAGLGHDYNVPIQHNIYDANNWNFTNIWKKVDNNYPILNWQ